jgi:ribosomal protein S18 acetylase RimI-like enzyme
MKPLFPDCSCPNADCPRHRDCDACLENHEGNGYCKRTAVIFSKDIASVSEEMLAEFSSESAGKIPAARLLLILQNSYRVFAAYDTASKRIAGIITAISDGTAHAHITLLEVLPAYKGKRIGSWLLRLMRKELADIETLSLCHGEELAPFFARFEPSAQANSTLFVKKNCEKTLPLG